MSVMCSSAPAAPVTWHEFALKPGRLDEALRDITSAATTGQQPALTAADLINILLGAVTAPGRFSLPLKELSLRSLTGALADGQSRDLNARCRALIPMAARVARHAYLSLAEVRPARPRLAQDPASGRSRFAAQGLRSTAALSALRTFTQGRERALSAEWCTPSRTLTSYVVWCDADLRATGCSPGAAVGGFAASGCSLASIAARWDRRDGGAAGAALCAVHGALLDTCALPAHGQHQRLP